MEACSSRGVPVKVVVVGDCKCGKTCLIHRYITNSYSEIYRPTGFESYTTTYDVSATYRINISIWDTSGDSGLDGVRPLSYDGADIIIICFSLAEPDSFENVSKKWLPEVREHCTEQPIVLVGCKSDLRADDTQPVKLKQEIMSTYEQGLTLAKDIGALVYTETSAKSSAKSVTDMFEVAGLSAAASQPNAPKPKRQLSFMRRRHSSALRNLKSSKSCVLM